MPTMRTLPKAMEIIKEEDPNTAITIGQLRKWAKTGKIQTVKAGHTFLCDMDKLKAFLLGEGR